MQRDTVFVPDLQQLVDCFLVKSAVDRLEFLQLRVVWVPVFGVVVAQIRVGFSMLVHVGDPGRVGLPGRFVSIGAAGEDPAFARV